MEEKKVEEIQLQIDPETGEVLNDLEDSLSKMDEVLEGHEEKFDPSALSDLSLFDSTIEDKQPQPYTTELLKHIQEIEPTMTPKQAQELVEYVKGSPRPEFMDTMITQTNDKLNECIKMMTIFQLLRLPALFDYQSALQKNLLDAESITKMSFDEIAKVSENVSKEISNSLALGLKVSTTLSQVNAVPTKVERLANKIMGVSESTRERIEEIIKTEMELNK